jgi:hypothetical protein
MSKRGAEFGAWTTENVLRGSVGADTISVAELTAKLFADAKVTISRTRKLKRKLAAPTRRYCPRFLAGRHQ